MPPIAPIVIWITGLPGSGKSTIAHELRKRRPEFFILRMDALRKIATPNPTYREEERDILYRSLVFTAKTLYELGHDVIIDATGNLRRWREIARSLIPDFVEVYLKCPLPLCIEREKKRWAVYEAPKDIYEKAKAGWPVPGVVAPYEEPLQPEVVIDAEKTGVEESVKIVEEFLSNRLKYPH